jgi:hypothetical protein
LGVRLAIERVSASAAKQLMATHSRDLESVKLHWWRT